MRPMILLCLSFAVVAALLGASQEPSSSGSANSRRPANSPPGEMMAMPLVAPLFVENGQLSSSITIVNAAAAATTADIILLDQQGLQIAKRTAELPGHSQKVLKISELLKGAHAIATIGSVEIMPESKAAANMSVVAQLSIEISDPVSPSYLEEEFLMPSPMGSGIFQATSPSVIGDPVLALLSMAKAPQTVTVNCIQERTVKGVRTRQLQLAPGQMVITSSCEAGREVLTTFEDGWNQRTLGKKGATGISVATTGKSGDLGVYGFAISGERDHPAYISLNFNDAGLVQSSNTVFTGVPVGRGDLFPTDTFVPEVAIVNFGAQPSTAKILYSTTDDTGPKPATVATVTLPAESSKSITLSGLTGDSQMRNSFIVQSDAPVGSFVANLVSVGQQFRSIQSIGKDQKQVPNSGAHPWTTADGMTSNLLLFNHSSGEQSFDVNISAGGVLWQQQYKLGALETKSVSINELIATGAKDKKGRALPNETKEGEVGWSVPRASNGTGRLLVSRPDISLARSFSCGTQDVVCALLLDPYPLDLTVGASVPVSADYAQYCTTCWPSCSDCTGSYDYTGDGYPVDWSSEDTSIATLDGSGYVYGQAGGTTGLNAIGDPYCMQGTVPTTVHTPTSLSVVSVTSLGCAGSVNYGERADIAYQVLDQNGQSMAVSGMTPYEQGTLYDGSTLTHRQLGQPTDSMGTFHDNPNGYCQNLPLSNSLTATQTISVTLNGTEYNVRTQHITLTVPPGAGGFGHGTLKNDLPNTTSPDINVAR